MPIRPQAAAGRIVLTFALVVVVRVWVGVLWELVWLVSLRSLGGLPKAHLHVHVDGSYPVEAVRELAGRRGRGFVVPEAFGDVNEFFSAYGLVPELVAGHEDLAGLCRALVFQEAAEGVVYLEPAVEPQLYAPRLGDFGQVLRTMLAAFAEAGADAGVEVGALVTVNVDVDESIAEELAGVAAGHAGRGVTAFGTAGFVEPANLGRFRSSVGIARSAGLSIVCHAGQTGGPDSVVEALDELGADRVSHGFRAVESAQLLARLAGEQVVCDVCPVSNVKLGLVSDVAVHPAPRMVAAGVPVTLNADDQLWFGASVTDQYQIARDVWGLDDVALSSFALAGALAAGMSETTRNRLRDGVQAWLTQDTSMTSSTTGS